MGTNWDNSYFASGIPVIREAVVWVYSDSPFVIVYRMAGRSSLPTLIETDSPTKFEGHCGTNWDNSYFASGIPVIREAVVLAISPLPKS